MIYSFRAQGCYLEVSYFVAAATLTYIVVPPFVNISGAFRIIVLAALLFLFGMSGTGNLILFIGFVTVAFVFRFNFEGGLGGLIKKKRSRMEWMLLFLLLIGCFAAVLYFVSNMDAILNSTDFDIFSKGWADGIASSNLSNADNSERVTYMLNAVAEFARYPWGGGYNMAPSLTFADYGTAATFNYVLTLLIELGPFGFIAYLYLVGSLIFNLLKFSGSQRTNGVVLSVVVMALFAFQVANGIGLTPLVWCVLALGSIEVYDKKNEGGGDILGS